MGFLSLIVGNWKAILFGIAFLAASFFLWNVYNIITENATNKVLIEQYRKNELVLLQTIQSKDLMIALKDKVISITNDTIVKRDSEIDKLNITFEGIVNPSLGTDLYDPAPESLKELMRRIGATL